MTRFILVDNNSGYVWGEARAASPIEAARIVDEQLGEFGRGYVEISADPRSTTTGYHVYEAPEEFREIDDGQNQGLIDAVSALPFVAFVQVS